MDKTFHQHWGKSRQLPSANEAKFWIQYGLNFHKEQPRLDILGGCL